MRSDTSCSNKCSLKISEDKRPDDGSCQAETCGLKDLYCTVLYNSVLQNMQLTLHEVVVLFKRSLFSEHRFLSIL